jgi:hypothetical protein
MALQFCIFVGFFILALTAVLMWRHTGKLLIGSLLLFIRRDFPPDQRDAAREMAAVLAELVGIEIKQLRPEHTLKQIAEWETSDLAIADKNLSLTTLGLTIPPLLLSYCNIATVNLKPHYQKYDCNSRHTAINASSRKSQLALFCFL